MSVKKNLIKNGIASLLQKGVKIAEQLLLVPFFITAWGVAHYGEWLTLTIIPTIIGFSDLGFGTAAANAFVLKYASNDKQGAADSAASGFRAINLAVMACIVLSICAMFVLDYYRVFDKSLIESSDAIYAVSFLMAARILGFYQQLFDAYFRSARKASISINLQTLYSFTSIVVSLFVLLGKGNVVLFAISQFIIAIVFTIVHALLAIRVLPDLWHLNGIVRKEDLKAIIHKGFGFLLSPIWQAVFFQGTTFVVRIVLGPVAVTIFNTVRTVCRAINQANAIIISTTLPEMQYEIGANNFDKARRLFRISLFLVVLSSFFGMLMLFLGGQWLYEIWTHKALNTPLFMWHVFIVGIGFNALWWSASFVFPAMNKPMTLNLSGFIGATLSVACSYYLSSVMGLEGAALGSLLMEVFLFVYLVPRSFALIEQSKRQFVNDLIGDVVLIKNNFRMKLFNR